MKRHHRVLRGLVALWVLAGPAGCDPEAERGAGQDTTTQTQTQTQREGASGSFLCGYAYAEPNFQGKQVRLSPTLSCEERPLDLDSVASAALSPNCSVDLLRADGTKIIHTDPSPASAPPSRPALNYEGALGDTGAVSYSCHCEGDNYPLVAEALEDTTRDIAAGKNSLPLWNRGAIDLSEVGGGTWANAISAMYYPSGRGSVFADLGAKGVAFMVGAQSGDDEILELASEYGAGIPVEETQDIDDLSMALDPYVVVSDPEPN